MHVKNVTKCTTKSQKPLFVHQVDALNWLTVNHHVPLRDSDKWENTKKKSYSYLKYSDRNYNELSRILKC